MALLFPAARLSLLTLLHSLPALLVLAVAGVVVLLVPLPDRGALDDAGVALLPALVAALVLARVGTSTRDGHPTYRRQFAIAVSAPSVWLIPPSRINGVQEVPDKLSRSRS